MKSPKPLLFSPFLSCPKLRPTNPTSSTSCRTSWPTTSSPTWATPLIKTPVIDQFAREGIRFTQALAGSPVCGPLALQLDDRQACRACVGPGERRRNPSSPKKRPLPPSSRKEATPRGLRKVGMRWTSSTGVPEKHGFDLFFGYYDQVHAHSFYPPYLIRNSEEVHLPGTTADVPDEPTPNIRSWTKPFASLSKTRTPLLLLPAFHPHPTGCTAFPKTNPRGNSTRVKSG